MIWTFLLGIYHLGAFLFALFYLVLHEKIIIHPILIFCPLLHLLSGLRTHIVLSNSFLYFLQFLEIIDLLLVLLDSLHILHHLTLKVVFIDITIDGIIVSSLGLFIFAATSLLVGRFNLELELLEFLQILHLRLIKAQMLF